MTDPRAGKEKLDARHQLGLVELPDRIAPRRDETCPHGGVSDTARKRGEALL
jgi:hypothetical protein